MKIRSISVFNNFERPLQMLIVGFWKYLENFQNVNSSKIENFSIFNIFRTQLYKMWKKIKNLFKKTTNWSMKNYGILLKNTNNCGKL